MTSVNWHTITLQTSWKTIGQLTRFMHGQNLSMLQHCLWVQGHCCREWHHLRSNLIWSKCSRRPRHCRSSQHQCPGQQVHHLAFQQAHLHPISLFHHNKELKISGCKGGTPSSTRGRLGTAMKKICSTIASLGCKKMKLACVIMAHHLVLLLESLGTLTGYGSPFTYFFRTRAPKEEQVVTSPNV